MAAYLGVYILQSMKTSFQTSPVVMATVSESAAMTGLAVREETTLASDRAFVFVEAEDGNQISKSAVLASAADTEAAMERAGRKKQLELEISHYETLLSGLTNRDDLTKRDGAVRQAVLRLSASVSGEGLADLDGACAALGALVFKDSGAIASEDELNALRDELSAMQSSVYDDSEDIKAPEAGLFTTILDGFEAVTPADLADLTPSGLRLIMKSDAQPVAGAFGKLVTGWRWYFAAVTDAKAAAQLTVGDYVSVSFGRHYSENIAMRVESVSAPQNGECAVTLSTLKALSDTLAMRRADAEMIYSEQVGLRVPTKALHVDEDGDSFVYVIAAGLVDIRYVKTVCQTDDYFLVENETSPNALREGDEIIVAGRNIYEGMIIE
ncbi:MAG: HlyD family efflux transporter periplasmic adaptor subunit [Oscillospiraceae bacterium]